MISLLPTELWDYKLRDVFQGLVAGLHPNKSDRLLHIPGIGDCVPTRSGRAGIIASIKALNLPHNARIGVPLYCCPVVFKAIKAADCTPRFIDVDYSTYCMSVEDLFKKRLDIDGVIPVHMFGNMCDMPSLQEAVQGIPIIEDCAQSLGSTLNGRMAGSFGTIAVFSFRSGKYLSVGEGGALFSNNTGIRSRLSELIAEMPPTNIVNECVHIAATYIRSKLRNKPLYGVIGVPLWSFYGKNVDYSAQSPIILTQTYRSDLEITKKRLELLNSLIERQRVNADFYLSALKLDSDMLCSENHRTFYNRLQFPILFKSTEQGDFIADYLHRLQIGASKPYKDIAKIAATHYGYTGDCPVSEQIAKRVLVIPCNYRLKKATVQRIAQAVNTAWAEIAT